MNTRDITWCRHCGSAGPVTAEHVPPRSVNNRSPVRLIADPFDARSVVREVAEWDDGHVVKTLDLECNNRASRWGYVAEYRRWSEELVRQARAVAGQTGTDPLRGGQPFSIGLPYDVHPARFARQVIGMLLAVQSTEYLFATYPALTDLVGPDPADDSQRRHGGLTIEPLHLYISVCNANWSYLEAPMLAVESHLDARATPLWTPPASPRLDDVLLLSLSPFLFVLTTKLAADLGKDISEWTTWSVHRRPGRSERSLVLPTADQMEGGLRSMVYPAEYTVRAASMASGTSPRS